MIRQLRLVPGIVWMGVAASVVACKGDDPEPESSAELAKGDACDPDAAPPAASDGDESEGPPACAQGLACEPVDGSEGDFVCGTAVQLRGRVTDVVDGHAVEGARVAALDEAGEPVTDVATTDSCGDYVLPVSVRRDADGEFVDRPKWTLNVSAQDYLPFPAGLRPALPIDLADAVPDPDPEPSDETGGEPYVDDVIDNGATSVGLIPLPGDERGGSIVSGQVDGDRAPGMLVVAEGTAGRAPYGIVDASGSYTLFNVLDGTVTIRGYRRGMEVEPAIVEADGRAFEHVDLSVISDVEAELGTVDGSLSIVNAPGGSETSVVLIPTSVYNAGLERGPVPVGLRVPDAPRDPDVSGQFGFVGVPSGDYQVLVAFENDQLVRDPDEGIAGTAILQISVARGAAVELQDNFKVTEALQVFGPGADVPELVDAMPTFSFADDSSEDGYVVVVYDALGERVWETEVPGVSGSDSVDVPYGGPTLEPGMYYQFRATSFRDPPNGERTFISRTEDLRGVFVTGVAEPAAACEAPADPGGTTGG